MWFITWAIPPSHDSIQPRWASSLPLLRSEPGKRWTPTSRVQVVRRTDRRDSCPVRILAEINHILFYSVKKITWWTTTEWVASSSRWSHWGLSSLSHNGSIIGDHEPNDIAVWLNSIRCWSISICWLIGWYHPIMSIKFILRALSLLVFKARGRVPFLFSAKLRL